MTPARWRTVLFTPEPRLSEAICIGAIVRDADGVLTPLRRSVCPTLASWPHLAALQPVLEEHWRRVPGILGWRAQDAGPMCGLGPVWGLHARAPRAVDPVAWVQGIIDGVALWRPPALRDWLRAEGWRLHSVSAHGFETWRRPAADDYYEVNIPLGPPMRDHSRRVTEVVETLSMASGWPREHVARMVEDATCKDCLHVAHAGEAEP
jgi:hypothetical protein